MVLESETMHHVSVGDTEIAYSERGHGEPIVLVHAGVFSEWFRPLSLSPTLDGFRVIRVQRAGYGPVSPTQHLTLRDHARQVGALADHLGLSKIHWVGHSSSCQIGVELALDRSDLVHTLILLEPAGTGGFAAPPSEESEALGREFFGPAIEAFGAGDLETAFSTFLHGVGEEDPRAVLEGRLGQEGYKRAVRESAFFFRDEMPAVQEWQLGEDDAGRVRQPVLVVEGGASGWSQITARATELLPHAEVVTIAGVNHMMPLQNPDAVGRVISTFARRHPMAPAESALGS